MTYTHRSGLGLLATTLLFFCLLSSCTSNPPAVEQEPEPETEQPAITPNESWAAAVSSGSNIAAQYDSLAIRVAADGSYLQGAANIAQRQDKMSIDTIFTIASFPAGREGEFTYEIGGFRTTDGQDYRHLVIQSKKQSSGRQTYSVVRTFDWISKVHLGALPDTSDLTSFRKLWIERCNAHNAYELVAQSYTPNALYYNHKPLVIGTEAIAEEYSYMNRPEYSLLLTPLAVEMVSTDLAFEIGQCAGSYSGKYVLVWQKNAEEVWQVLFDSNI
ncbi:MAG: hypothetical protein AAFO02_21050 [Bacteroidota bacterium]